MRQIERPDLLDTLDRAASLRVTLISAPPGSGKTSLLRAWAAAGRTEAVAMVHVERDEQDAQRFWLALLTAVRRARTVAAAVVVPTATPGFNGSAMVDKVLAELAESPDQIILIIDDVHELRAPGASEQLTRLLMNLPGHVHAVLATRRDLPLRLHQLRLSGELAEIRAADLRFSERETRELLAATGVTMSDPAVRSLHQRTEGWAAGLRLAAIALGGHADPEQFVAAFSGSDRTVAEYLIAEMLDRQPADVLHLLLTTSVLDRVNGELADLLSGRPGSERILLDLEDANAFVVSLDHDRTWFRYHHLFADFLRLELRRTMPEPLATLHRLAAEWWLAHGQIVDAIRHLQAAGAWPEAARILADHAFSLWLDGQAPVMQALLEAFPSEAGVDPADLALARAVVTVLQGRLDDVAAHLAVARAHVDPAIPGARSRLVAITALELTLARRRGSVAGVLDHVEFLEAGVSGPAEGDLALAGDLRAVTLMNMGAVQVWAGRTSEAERHLEEGVKVAREIGRPFLEVTCLGQLGYATKARSMVIATRICHETLATAERYGWGADWIVYPALITLAEVAIYTGEFDQGERWLARTTVALGADSGPAARTLLHRASGMYHAGRGEARRAAESFEAAERSMQQLTDSYANADQVTGWRLTMQARLGMADAARASLDALPPERARSAEVRMACAAIRLADGDPAGALDTLGAIAGEAAPEASAISRIEEHLLLAHAHRALGDVGSANRALERALELAEADRLILPFVLVEAGPLLEALPRHQTSHAALVADILDVMRGASPHPHGGDSPMGVEELSPTELRVLRFLPTNLTRTEIAGELSVSVNTVNTHVRNIYAKLQASDRSSAVQRARELRLLSDRPSR